MICQPPLWSCSLFYKGGGIRCRPQHDTQEQVQQHRSRCTCNATRRAAPNVMAFLKSHNGLMTINYEEGGGDRKTLTSQLMMMFNRVSCARPNHRLL